MQLFHGHPCRVFACKYWSPCTSRWCSRAQCRWRSSQTRSPSLVARWLVSETCVRWSSWCGMEYEVDALFHRCLLVTSLWGKSSCACKKPMRSLLSTRSAIWCELLWEARSMQEDWKTRNLTWSSMPITPGIHYFTTVSCGSLVELGESEAYLLCLTDVTGIVEVQAKNACHQEGHRRFVFVKTSEGNMVADMMQYATMTSAKCDVTWGFFCFCVYTWVLCACFCWCKCQCMCWCLCVWLCLFLWTFIIMFLIMRMCPCVVWRFCGCSSFRFLSVYIIFSVCKCSCVCFCRCNQVMCMWMFPFLRRLGMLSAKCDVTWKCRRQWQKMSNNTNIGQAAHGLRFSRWTSWRDSLGGDDMYHSREWSRTDDSAYFPCCVRTASSSSSRLVDDACLPETRDRPVSHWHGGGGSKLRDGNFDLFPWDPACRKGCPLGLGHGTQEQWIHHCAPARAKILRDAWSGPISIFQSEDAGCESSPSILCSICANWVAKVLPALLIEHLCESWKRKEDMDVDTWNVKKNLDRCSYAPKNGYGFALPHLAPIATPTT